MPKKKIDNVMRILNCEPSQDTEKDWGFQDATNAGISFEPVALPPTMDLRDPSWWAISDQADTGSCVGWSVADSVVRWHMVKCNKIQPEDHLSVRYLWMAAKETDEFITRPSTFIEDEGTSIKAALDVARKYGVVLDKMLPFMSPRLFQGNANAFYTAASQLRINSYFNLGLDQAAWHSWLANNGPISTRLNVDATWDNATTTAGRLETYQPGTTRGGHAVSLVGYLEDCFIVRNSWGEGWGDKGFAYASFQYAQAAFTEAYGISVS